MTSASIDKATKQDLRILCKSNGIKGWGKMSNDQMRAALKAQLPRGNGDESAAVEFYREEEQKARATKKSAAKKSSPKKGTPAARRDGQPSIREWLAERLKKGPLPIADAIAYAEKTKRSKVTVYRMAAACGARAEKGVFVPA